MEREAEKPGPGNGECAWPEEEQGNPYTVRFARLFACRADLPFFLRLPRISRRFWGKSHGPASSREFSSSDVLPRPLNPSLRNAAADAFFRRSRYAGGRGVRRKGNGFCVGVRFYEPSSMTVRCAEAPGQHRGLSVAFFGPVRRS